jgi:hypothetical protein
VNDFSQLIEFDLDNGRKQVLNGMDFFRVAYSHSPVFNTQAHFDKLPIIKSNLWAAAMVF